VKVETSRVDAELRRLWDAESQEPMVSRAVVVTLVTFVSAPHSLDETLEAIAHVVQSIPARAITVSWHRAAEEGRAADIAIHRAPGGEALSDSIVLRAGVSSEAELVDRVERLFLVGVPVCVWWKGALGALHGVAERLARSVELFIVDSVDMPLSELHTIAGIATAAGSPRPLVDLAWARLETARELVARFFDDAERLPLLPEISRAAMVCSARPGDTDDPSTQEALFVGWLAAALELGPRGATWTRGLAQSEGVLRRARDGGAVVVHVAREARAGVPHGTLLSVELDCRNAQFVVARLPGDASLVSSSCRASGAVLSTQILQAEFVEDTQLLVQILRRPARDRMFEASLHMSRAMFPPRADAGDRTPASEGTSDASQDETRGRHGGGDD
jgi:glucose-6-phosphate dehydrogenase assembly protein OpcA